MSPNLLITLVCCVLLILAVYFRWPIWTLVVFGLIGGWTLANVARELGWIK